MPWTPFEHPQLGPVEIGGWRRMYTFRNPPPARYLAEMAHANCRFTLRHAACAPKLRLRDLTVQPLAPDLYQISVVVDTLGFLATHLSHQALGMQAATPVAVTLAGATDLTFIQGQPTQSIGHLAGRLGRNMAYTRFYNWPPSNQAVTWTVRLAQGASPQFTIRAGCPRAGFVNTTVTIAPDGSFTATPAQVMQGRVTNQ